MLVPSALIIRVFITADIFIDVYLNKKKTSFVVKVYVMFAVTDCVGLED